MTGKKVVIPPFRSCRGKYFSLGKAERPYVDRHLGQTRKSGPLPRLNVNQRPSFSLDPKSRQRNEKELLGAQL